MLMLNKFQLWIVLLFGLVSGCTNQNNILDYNFSPEGNQLLVISGEFSSRDVVRYELLIEKESAVIDQRAGSLNDLRESDIGFERDFDFYDFDFEYPFKVLVVNKSVAYPDRWPRIHVQYGLVEEDERFGYLIRSEMQFLLVGEMLEVSFMDENRVILRRK